MPIMEVKTVTKKVAVFRTPVLSPNELIILMTYSLYNEADDHFDSMDDYTKMDIIRGLSSYWSHCGNECSCGEVFDEDEGDYKQDGDYRFDITCTFADKDNLSIRITIEDHWSGHTYTDVYSDADLMEFYDLVEFAGSDEDWDEVED